jgi:hypothetical protein
MTVVVFLGPTLPREEAERELDACYLPPAAFGDFYRAAREHPLAIGLIDGYFERVPSVWHKEILWALTRGIHVFGAASMGALRAAELQTFGMQGVGSIFEAFRSGALEDDDEVAVAHGPEDVGYRSSSEAMVNIRATLELARAERVISEELRNTLTVLAKQTFYPERNYMSLLAHARAQGCASGELVHLQDFIARRRVDAKRQDAFMLLRRLRQILESGDPAPRARFELSNSEPWTQVRKWVQSSPGPQTVFADAVAPTLVAAELRRTGDRGRGVRESALARALATRLGHLECNAKPEADILDTYREQHAGALDEFIVREARQASFYGELIQRAAHKRGVLGTDGAPEELRAKEGGVPASDVVEWYLALIEPELPPGEALTARHLYRLGFRSMDQLEIEALREFAYTRRLEGSPPEPR